jgi:hypothetical protein
MKGESAKVDNATVYNFQKKIPELCFGYSEKDIFNADESGLIF